MSTDQPVSVSDLVAQALKIDAGMGDVTGAAVPDLEQLATMDSIYHHARAALGAALSGKPATTTDLLEILLNRHGELAVNVGVGYLCEAAVGHSRHACAGGEVEIDFDMSTLTPDDPQRPHIEQCVRLAGELLTGALTGRDLRTATALKELTENPATPLPTMVLLARYAAARIMQVQEIAQQAAYAWQTQIIVPSAPPPVIPVVKPAAEEG